MKLQCLGLAAVVCAASFLSGCVASENYKAYREELDKRSYPRYFVDTWRDWFGDLSDIASAEVAVGEGIGVNVQATEIANTGFLWEDVMKFGWRNRAMGFYREVRKEGGLSWFYYRDMRFEPIIGTRALGDRERLVKGFPIRDDDDRHWMDVGLEFNAVYGGLSFFVSPKHALDFVGNTISLPFNLVARPVLNRVGVRPPELDLGDDDLAAQVRKRHGVELVKRYEQFPPTELLDQLERLPY